jgi:flavin reductase (NADH)
MAGVTVSSLCSVTDSPPTVLMCVNRSSRSHDVLAANRRVCVNVLGPDHQNVAVDFSGATGLTMAERFASGEWQDLDGVPALRGAAVSIVGHTVSETTQGSHTVMFIEVDQVVLGKDDRGLVYFLRYFHSLPN